MVGEKMELEGDSEIEIERDEQGSAINLDMSIAPPIKRSYIYPPLKEGEKE